MANDLTTRNWALLGDGAAIRPLITAIARNADEKGESAGAARRHRWVAVVRLDAADAPHVPLEGVAGVRYLSSWEELITFSEADAVVASGSSPELLTAVRQLAASGKPLLIDTSAEQSAEFIYELSLIRDDVRTPLQPVALRRFHPAVEAFRDVARELLVQPGSLLHWKRRTPADPGGDLTLATVQHAFFEDVDLLRFIAGEFDQVTALRAAGVGDRIARDHLVLAGPRASESQWSISTGPEPGWELVAHSSTGEATLEANAAGELTLRHGGHATVFDADQWTAAAFGQLAAFDSLMETGDASCNWIDAVRACDLLDAVDRSVRRRRTIELQGETVSERGQFKSQMAAAGCLVLLMTPVLMGAYLAVASAVSLPHPVLVVLRSLVFAPVVLFLAAQLLIQFAPRSAS